jgi:putative MATE family efflux protein
MSIIPEPTRRAFVLAWRKTSAFCETQFERLWPTSTEQAFVGPKVRLTPAARMTEGPILESLFGLALPIMGANLLMAANQFIDAFWVGRLGAVGVASVSVSTPIIFMLLTFGMGFGMAGSTIVAQYVGARRRDLVDHVAGQTLLTGVSVSLILAVLGFLSAPLLLDVMGVAPDVRAGALAFLHIALLTSPLSFAFFMFQSLMRGVGRTGISFTLTAVTVALNFLLNPILIFGIGPIPALGVAGSALSTLIAQFCAVAVAAYVLWFGRLGVCVRWTRLRPDTREIKRILMLGYPTAVEGMTRGLSLIVMTFLAAGFGTVSTASYGVGSTFLSLILIPSMGFSMATATLVGQNIGAGQMERAERVGRAAGAISFFGLAFFGLLAFLFAEGFVRMFVPSDQHVVHEASIFIRIMAWSLGFMGLQYACMGVMRSAGMMMATLLISLIAQWVVQFPLAYILAERTPLAMHGIYWAICISNIIACGMAVAMFLRGDWKRIRLIEPAPASLQP